MRLADYVIQFLEKKKIDTVFTVSGGGSIFCVMRCIKLKIEIYFMSPRTSSFICRRKLFQGKK